jgi:gamma-glutamyltranspeptidase/glutathione hydrolase
MKRPAAGAAAGPNHSTGVVAVDEQGNVAAILHSCNCSIWGTTGIFVDGVSIPDSASIQQNDITAVPPGGRLPDSTNPLIVLKDGKPVLVSTAMGFGLHETTFQNLVNILDFGMDPKTSVDQPNFRGASPDAYPAEMVGEGDFSAAVIEGLRARGQPVQAVARDNSLGQGFWIGIQIDRLGRRLSAGVTSAMNALAEGY